MIGYYTLTPFLFINRLHISAENFGYLSLISAGTYIAGVVLGRIFSSVETLKMVFVGTILAFLSSVVGVLCAIFYPMNIVTVLLPISLFTFAAGEIAPSSNAGALSSLRHLAGIGSAVAGASIYVSSSIFSSIATALPIHDLWPLVFYMGITSTLAFAMFLYLIVLPARRLNMVNIK
ncbi:MAG: hypothetical protein A3E84_00900 [Gammaproteobacteria bacterium RIFCSPHIGHO2_12_FULL_42_13]|nr:MAG: hypothetical protein A3E84_00900 [Gammaproteobacteria bacterium RIFCSPHIGHO2_12_FULL_42_13]